MIFIETLYSSIRFFRLCSKITQNERILKCHVLLLTIVFLSLAGCSSVKTPQTTPYNQSAKPTWKISIDQTKIKQENEFDVIIIGSGIGGLSCGALLAKNNYKVLILEAHSQVGGYCSSFTRDKFTFNVGVEDVSGLWERGPLTYLLRELGLNKKDLFIKNTRRYIVEGGTFDIPSTLDKTIIYLSEQFPEQKEQINNFFIDALLAYEQAYDQDCFNYFGIPLGSDVMVKVFGAQKLQAYHKNHKNFLGWLNKTFEQKLNEYFTDEAIKNIFKSLLGYIGSSAEQTQAKSVLISCLGYYLHGGHYTKGGAQHYTETLKKYIEDHNGKILCNHKVDKIITNNNKATGVIVGNKEFISPIIIANANAKHVILNLIDTQELPREYVSTIAGLKMSKSCFVLYLGVDMDLSDYPILIHNTRDKYSMVIASNADKTLAPKGKACVSLLTTARYIDEPEDKEEFKKYKEKIITRLLEKADKIIPDIAKHIVVQETATPRTFEKYTGMPEGALYAFDQSEAKNRPYYKTPLTGLYLASASTSGGGIEAVTITGIECAHDIMGSFDKQVDELHENKK